MKARVSKLIENRKGEFKQVVESKRNKLGYTHTVAGKIEKPVKVSKISDAKRLLSKLIYKLQTREIEGQEAKDLTYLLISYVNIIKDIEFEDRLKQLEEKVGDEKKHW